jgi:hypothetical protein
MEGGLRGNVAGEGHGSSRAKRDSLRWCPSPPSDILQVDQLRIRAELMLSVRAYVHHYETFGVSAEDIQQVRIAALDSCYWGMLCHTLCAPRPHRLVYSRGRCKSALADTRLLPRGAMGPAPGWRCPRAKITSGAAVKAICRLQLLRRARAGREGGRSVMIAHHGNGQYAHRSPARHPALYLASRVTRTLQYPLPAHAQVIAQADPPRPLFAGVGRGARSGDGLR